MYAFTVYFMHCAGEMLKANEVVHVPAKHTQHRRQAYIQYPAIAISRCSRRRRRRSHISK